MGADVPKLLPMEDTKEMWKRRLEFIINMTSGVVYSIVMHSVIITAYALLIFRIFYKNGFDLDAVDNDMPIPVIFEYFFFSAVEVGLRRFYHNTTDPQPITKSGHWAHFLGSYFLWIYNIPSNRIESLVIGLVEVSLMSWTFFVLVAFVLVIFLENDSLTQPILV